MEFYTRLTIRDFSASTTNVEPRSYDSESDSGCAFFFLFVVVVVVSCY